MPQNQVVKILFFLDQINSMSLFCNVGFYANAISGILLVGLVLIDTKTFPNLGHISYHQIKILSAFALFHTTLSLYAIKKGSGSQVSRVISRSQLVFWFACLLQTLSNPWTSHIAIFPSIMLIPTLFSVCHKLQQDHQEPKPKLINIGFMVNLVVSLLISYTILSNVKIIKI
jgi:hypothetical protein